ncbi:MAG TPA: tRNA pseudouridine(13) synthase TruD [Methanosarcinales archaeon]|nr:tRNA pseudouridine(13) synthase TruD [Methanosarcinales archaeon]
MNSIIPSKESKIGIEVYGTKTQGIGGVIKQKIEDFYVEEITNRTEGDKGNYIILELTKGNWDTNHLIREMSRILKVSKNRFKFAGTKDKRGITKQKISIWKATREDIAKINLSDLKLKVIGYSNKQIGLGDLWGNKFKIVIRNIDLSISATKERIESITQQIKENGIPNFFGVQRFGTTRPITHLVGEAIVHKDFERAALTYIALPCKKESEEARNAREYVWNTQDFKNGLKKFPISLRYERAMLNHLIENPKDYIGAFKVLSPNLRKMFVHAYQSYIFNKILSMRIKNNLPLNKALEGDVVCFKNKIGLPDVSRTQKVTRDTIDGINNLINKGRSYVTAPIVGYETQILKGKIGEIEGKVLKELKVNPSDFYIPQMPELSSKGLRREILLKVHPIYKVDFDDLNLGKTKVTLEFFLPKGCYATTVLREYIKG